MAHSCSSIVGAQGSGMHDDTRMGTLIWPWRRRCLHRRRFL